MGPSLRRVGTRSGCCRVLVVRLQTKWPKSRATLDRALTRRFLVGGGACLRRHRVQQAGAVAEVLVGREGPPGCDRRGYTTVPGEKGATVPRARDLDQAGSRIKPPRVADTDDGTIVIRRGDTCVRCGVDFGVGDRVKVAKRRGRTAQSKDAGWSWRHAICDGEAQRAARQKARDANDAKQRRAADRRIARTYTSGGTLTVLAANGAVSKQEPYKRDEIRHVVKATVMEKRVRQRSR